MTAQLAPQRVQVSQLELDHPTFEDRGVQGGSDLVHVHADPVVFGLHRQQRELIAPRRGWPFARIAAHQGRNPARPSQTHRSRFGFHMRRFAWPPPNHQSRRGSGPALGRDLASGSAGNLSDDPAQAAERPPPKHAAA